MAPWRLTFDGSKTSEGAGAGITIYSLIGCATEYSVKWDFPCTNNQAEYEALSLGLEILLRMRVRTVEIIGD